ncbi:MAG: nitroreductase family protein [Dehalococcoidia bacterium]
MFYKSIDTREAIHEPLARRWSGRAYDPERPVDRQALIAMLEAARWAPSCFGDQPWRYVIWDRFADATAWQRGFQCLAEGNRSWARAAPILMVACADTRLTRNGEPNRWGSYDTGAASMSLCIQATVLGLMVHQMGGFDAAMVAREFAIPDRYHPMAMITVGYQLPRERIDASVRDREEAARLRRPLGQSFFFGEWEHPVVD